MNAGLDPRQVELWRQLEILTREMRGAQMDYFKNRTQASLLHAKHIEKAVDATLLSLRSLFGEPDGEPAG